MGAGDHAAKAVKAYRVLATLSTLCTRTLFQSTYFSHPSPYESVRANSYKRLYR
jgi:hypothetical protein